MLRRDADCAFWCGRYLERAECVARMVDVHYHFCLESPLAANLVEWDTVLEISGLEEDYRKRFRDTDERSVLHFFAFDPENPSSILSSVRTARENARGIRDQVSSELFESLNRLYLELREWDVDRVLKSSPFAFFRKVKDGCQLLEGVMARTLLRGEVSDFIDAGRFLERADQTARILDVRYHDLLDDQPQMVQKMSFGQAVMEQTLPVMTGTQGWVAVLKSVGAYEAYRKTYQLGVSPACVAEFLIFSLAFPASVRFCIREVDWAIRRISGNLGVAPTTASERSVGRLYTDLNYTSAEEVLARGLHDFLEDVQARCAEVGISIHSDYLSY